MKKTLLIALSLLLAACSSPTPNFFQPTAITNATTGYTEVKNTILLNQVILPAMATKPQITTLGEENYVIRIDEFNRWGAAPERMVQQVLNDNLSVYLPNATIENQTPLRKNYQYAIAVEINEFTGRLGEFASLKASYFIKNKQGKLVKSGKFAQKIGIDGDYEAYVPAQSQLLGLLAEQIAAGLAKI